MPINRIFTDQREKQIAAVGIVSFAVAAFSGFKQPGSLWPYLFVNVLFYMTIIFGCAVFLAIQHVANAAWSSAIRRVPETVLRLLPLASILLLAVTYFGGNSIYSWMRTPIEVTDPAMRFKAFYLTPAFFFVRMILILLVWNYLVRALLRESSRQDIDAASIHTDRSRKISAFSLVIFGFTLIPATFDWVLSLEPDFYSTIYVLYIFSGMFLSGFTAITIIAIALHRSAILPLFHDGHLHSLRKLVFGFATFWAYIWLCQYLLIYYANLPEETVYYARRMNDGWSWIFIANLFLNWIIPFAILLQRETRKNEARIVIGSSIVLLGHWIDVYHLVIPVFSTSPAMSFSGIAGTVGFASLFVFAYAKVIRRVLFTPAHDPYLVESVWKDPYEVTAF